MKLGIMQGRLVPPEANRFQCFPRHRWREEFPIAAAAGMETIEWIYDAYGEDVNPLCTDTGVREIEQLCSINSVGIESVCADWFMDFPLVGADIETARLRWQRLEWLLRRCALLSINRVVLPFVDASAIRTPEDVEAVVAGINQLGDLIDETRVEVHLETSLAPSGFAALLARLPRRRVKVNYDAGNSASLGYQPQEEFASYGLRVGSVHLKDRRFGSGTVALGEGDTQFDELFEALAGVGYRGDFILQVARGADGSELEWTKSNARAARRMMQRLGGT